MKEEETSLNTFLWFVFFIQELYALPKSWVPLEKITQKNLLPFRILLKKKSMRFHSDLFCLILLCKHIWNPLDITIVNTVEEINASSL